MKKLFPILAAIVSAALLAAPAEAKKKAKPAEEGQVQEQPQQEGGGESANANPSGIPRYVPFPHYRNFVLKEINGKAPPPVDIWINIDATGRANGFSGCKNWSGVFIIGPERLGPKSMPAVNERQCDGNLASVEKELWGVLLSGPYWDVKGDELTLKGAKGGVLKFQRSL
jgi:heat shock protein HslJ